MHRMKPILTKHRRQGEALNDHLAITYVAEHIFEIVSPRHTVLYARYSAFAVIYAGSDTL
jgi:hypothetical protein